MVADLGGRVLIADRDATLRQLLYSRLLNADLFSDCVATGREALERLVETSYAVTVIDVTLADVDAVQVIEAIAQIAPARRPVVLVLAERPEAARTLDVEIVQIVLRKPVDMNQLVELIASCARSATRRSENVSLPPPKNGDQLTS
jgi:DNA-binding NtrC family response regulator